LRTVFDLALRQTEGFMVCINLLGLDLAVSDYSTMSRRPRRWRCRVLALGASPCICWWTARD
jgi:hypothetical protein